jgi:peptidoglycan/LPS O-acetylase OafA/YrhL
LLVAIGYPAALAAVMLALALAPERLQRPVANRPIRWLADISYAVYLIHFAVIWFALLELSLPQAGTVWSAVAWMLLVLPVSIGYAYLSARFLERPVRRWARRISGDGARGSHAPA